MRCVLNVGVKQNALSDENTRSTQREIFRVSAGLSRFVFCTMLLGWMGGNFCWDLCQYYVRTV